MKNLKGIVVLMICLYATSFLAHANTDHSGFAKYKIEAVEDIASYKSAEKVWKLTYNGCENPVVVVKRSASGEAVYIARTEYFEVCYSSSPKGFGTRAIKKSWCTVPQQLNDAVLNPDEIGKQHVITPGQVDDETALGLIASYLPDLLNENYRHLLYN